jgi:hypothetical protein
MSYGEWKVAPAARWLWGILTALVLILLIAIGVAALIGAIAGNVFALAIFALAVPLAYWSGRACSRVSLTEVTINAEEIVIVGPLRTTRILTGHADSFVAEVRPSPTGGIPTISLRYDTHRSIGLWIFNRYSAASRYERDIESLAPRVEELNEALAQARSGRIPAPASEPVAQA